MFASYWPAYRIVFETRERIVAAESRLTATALRGGRVVPRTPTKLDESRHPEYFTVVLRHPDAAFVRRDLYCSLTRERILRVGGRRLRRMDGRGGGSTRHSGANSDGILMRQPQHFDA